MTKFIRIVLALVAAAAIFFAAIPIVMYWIFNVGVAALLVIAALFIAEVCLLAGSKRSAWEVFARRGGAVVIAKRSIAVLLALVVIGEVVMSVIMLRPVVGAQSQYTDPPATAVVLGSQIKEDRPSLMLQRRLEQALIYLNSAPEAKVVVTGGMDSIYPYTEASVEAKWLMERGIAEDRIIIEDKSRDTNENLQNAVARLLEQSLPVNNLIIFTDGFHQLRSQLYARLAISATTPESVRDSFFAAQVSGVASSTPWGLVPCHWLREQAALAEAFFFTDIHKMYLPFLQ